MTASPMLKEFQEASKLFKEVHPEGPVLVITHNDADGLLSGSIIHKALLRECYPAHTRSVKRLDKEIIKEMAKEKRKALIFTDLGSGQLDEIGKLENEFVMVLDHHQPKEAQADIIHINPHLFGIDGAREISGSGMAYLFCRALNRENKDLSALAMVGAVGDIQDANGEFKGMNKQISEEGAQEGVLKIEKDLRLFGRQTRPLYKAIEYTTEPFIPGLSGSESASIQFLKDLGIPLKKGEKYVMLADLNKDERKRLVTALILKMIEHKVPSNIAENIVGEVCTLLHEEKRTPLRDAKEYATLLNACGKNNAYSIGIAVCLGERGEFYKKSISLLKEHKAYLSSCFSWISQNTKEIKAANSIYYFHSGKKINENVIGTVVSMVINSRILDPINPVIGFAEAEKGEIKASARGTRELVEKGLNLGIAMRYAAEKLGGEGGGHDIAAGAQIKKGKEEEFIKYADEIITEQLK